ncbi:hypothetical protein [uncultured Christiangramia sp.]|uniref:hypothetical protein n=1 Tax=Christiangramia sp. 3-2217-3z TaxID=3417564 RepID=UPI0025E5DEB0|nr:hypothetical protein [uncultured Christiangramia sp.]|tara:strand:- start:677 stop:961 length:285 start_codon:yes stop_codon:yes gene_type:complete
MSEKADRYLVLISKIIFFYSIFFVVMKVISMFQGAWVIPNLILSLPYLVFGLVGGYMVKYNRYHWAYVIAGVILISIVRYYEVEWMLQLQERFS